ncbi:hypothetical protein AMTRI_Chr01g131890 [Amborella trichopoda]|uniref:L-ascorbate oxidase n=1 Tax=Amborella trichopoda TaxID=13333 RepID=W1PPZ8_AMBTC|nr:L-ascorbate oxidase homolog [Amborella trichopoda]ERN12112.1 hypothetical protein AMTR_s00159p00040990 [Amborella trichopoda]|eukprot:XP_006850531.1 L-ascorbate oxidase homolog [Amborella trichopoda]
MGRFTLFNFFLLSLLCTSGLAENPYRYFTWKVTYGTVSPLGVPQEVIMINDQFPGPNINSTTNDNIVVNVFNQLDEPFLISWNGVQQRKNSWQDGMPGTNCPIPPGGNYTYQFQVKDQIGTYFYFLSTSFHKAAGGFGGLRVNSRMYIPVPFDPPAEDYTLLIGDWYTKSHKELRKRLDDSKSLGKPCGVLINGRTGKNAETLTVEPGKTYRIRISNVGIKTSLNFRIEGHALLLVEIEGSHTVQNVYESLDVHVGQSYSVLVTANQAVKDYQIVASTRFTKYILTGTAVLHYSGATEGVSDAALSGPTGVAFSLNQFRSFRWNLTASAARPNPQGSYHYGSIPIVRTIKLASSIGKIEGKLRYAINGVSYKQASTPLKLADYYEMGKEVWCDKCMPDSPPEEEMKEETNVVDGVHRDFIEIVFENREKTVQTWHLNGYSFFAVGMSRGTWTPESRNVYNLFDAISRSNIQVYPKSWSAILLTTDNAGMWSLRSEIWERQYLGQQLYLRIPSPVHSLRDEYDIPLNTPHCGLVANKGEPTKAD